MFWKNRRGYIVLTNKNSSRVHQKLPIVRICPCYGRFRGSDKVGNRPDLLIESLLSETTHTVKPDEGVIA